VHMRASEMRDDALRHCEKNLRSGRHRRTCRPIIDSTADICNQASLSIYTALRR
jgi:hypothetical protein